MMDNVSDPRESCCYCSEYGCQNSAGWLDDRGEGCDWYERAYAPKCAEFEDTWPDENGITAREACCHCVSPPCYDYNGWVDTTYGLECDWYEESESRCRQYGHWTNDDGITAIDACCRCGGGESNIIPSASPSHSNEPTVISSKPTITPSVRPTDKPSLRYKPTVTPSVTPTDKPSHNYEPTVSPSVTPDCYDYVRWVDNRVNGCDWYERQVQTVCSDYAVNYIYLGLFAIFGDIASP